MKNLQGSAFGPVVKTRCSGTATTLLVPAILIAGLAPVQAGQWTSDLGATLTTTYDDNPTLSENDKTENGKLEFTPTLSGQYEEDRYRLNLSGSVVETRSNDQEVEEDDTRFNAEAGGEYLSENSTLGVELSYSLDSVQNTQFDDTGLLENTADVTQTDASVGLNFDLDLSDRWDIVFSNVFETSEFSGGDFTEFKDNAFNIALNNEFSDQISLNTSFEYAIFDPNDDSVTNTFELDFGGRYELSEDSSLFLTVGATHSGGALGWSLDSGYERQFEKGGFEISALREINPSADGQLRESSEISMNVNYQISESLEAELSARFRRSSEAGNENSGDRDQIEISPSISWTLTEELSARLSLRERQQREDESGLVRSRSAILTIDYNLPL